jgi:hypothetical protein
MTDKQPAMDLTLKDIGQYYGTQEYHSLRPLSEVKATDGVAYIMKNGYSFFVTDAIAVYETDKEVRKEEFLCIKLIVNNGTADLIITDGNEKGLYKQHYGYTNTVRNLTLYLTNGVILLSGEY